MVGDIYDLIVFADTVRSLYAHVINLEKSEEDEDEEQVYQGVRTFSHALRSRPRDETTVPSLQARQDLVLLGPEDCLGLRRLAPKHHHALKD
jgi:hypothetical protein